MGNCLVTKLKDVVNNDMLPHLGSFIINFTAGNCKVWLPTNPTTVKYALSSNAYFTDLEYNALPGVTREETYETVVQTGGFVCWHATGDGMLEIKDNYGGITSSDFMEGPMSCDINQFSYGRFKGQLSDTAGVCYGTFKPNPGAYRVSRITCYSLDSDLDLENVTINTTSLYFKGGLKSKNLIINETSTTQQNFIFSRYQGATKPYDIADLSNITFNVNTHLQFLLKETNTSGDITNFPANTHSVMAWNTNLTGNVRDLAKCTILDDFNIYAGDKLQGDVKDYVEAQFAAPISRRSGRTAFSFNKLTTAVKFRGNAWPQTTVIVTYYNDRAEVKAGETLLGTWNGTSWS